MKKLFPSIVVAALFVPALTAQNCIGVLVQAIDVGDAQTVAVVGRNLADINFPIGDHQDTLLMLAVEELAQASVSSIPGLQNPGFPKLLGLGGAATGALLFIAHRMFVRENFRHEVLGASGRSIINRLDWIKDNVFLQYRYAAVPSLIGLGGMLVTKKLQEHKKADLVRRRTVVEALLGIHGIDLARVDIDGKNVFDRVVDYMLIAVQTKNALLRDAMIDAEALLLNKLKAS